MRRRTLYYHTWGFHLLIKTNVAAFQLSGSASVETCGLLWFRRSINYTVYALVCLHSEVRYSICANTQEDGIKRVGRVNAADGNARGC